MPGLVVAADLSSLRAAAATIGGAGGAGDQGGAAPGGDCLGHPEGDAAVADFHAAMHAHTAALAGSAARGAAAMTGYFVAFRVAGD